MSEQGIYGIDLGTTYSVVAYIDETGRPAVVRNTDGDDTTPSVVYFETPDNFVVGKTAKEAASFRPDDVVSLIKREMGNQDYTRTFYGQELSPSGISALILAALAKSTEEETHRPVKQVVITVPAYFGLLEKDATKKAGEIAGLDVIGIVPEPVAAALAYGVTGSADGSTFLVYDLGGGTFDITLIKMTDTAVEVLAVDGDHKLGGTDWDARLFEYLKDQTIEQSGDDSIEDDEESLSELRRLAEETKKALTKAESKKVNHRLAGGMATSITVTRQQFEELTSDLLEETIKITNRMLADAETRFPGVRGQINDLLLVGGSSRMPMVAERVRKEYPWDPKVADPDLAVAKGAALYAAGQTVKLVEAEVGGGTADAGPGTGSGQRSRSLPGAPSTQAIAAVAASTGLETEQVKKLAGKTIVNVLPKAVGIKLLDSDKPNWQSLPDEEKFYTEHLVSAQTQLPYKAEVFTAGTSVDNQDSIEIEIWEQAGAVPDQTLSANHRIDNAGLIEGLGSFRLPAGSPIEITFEVDAEGTVDLLAVEPTSGRQLKMSVKIEFISEEQVDKEKAIVTALRRKAE
ncbi:MAG TPA: Hsp70 family protein [Trebonia sp.]|nr:Hsp70 family protein [Trebonia sp.]